MRKVKSKKDGFNIDDFVADVTSKTSSSSDLSGHVEYRLIESKNKTKTKYFALKMPVGVIDYLGAENGNKIMMFHHREDPRRILLLKHEKGLSFFKPRGAKNYLIRFRTSNKEILMLKLSDPKRTEYILRPRKMIEFVIDNSFEDKQ